MLFILLSFNASCNSAHGACHPHHLCTTEQKNVLFVHLLSFSFCPKMMHRIKTARLTPWRGCQSFAHIQPAQPAV
ncbi:hypothetical protein BJY52DRAFT_1290336 [Lactarius psammicola]|nr:hypothetical protein BJY52DRAFT_1290336 [Lactarius psammicola]